MNRSQQRLKSIKIHYLKSVNELSISFEDKNVTAILGPNGNGKSTILHAIACVYKPQNIGENYRFSNFFLPNTDALWNDSQFEISHSFRKQAVVTNNIRKFKKTQIRWTPRYDKRPVRDCFFIGIDKCVPMIEKEKKQARINYSTEEVSIQTVQQILDKASFVLNKSYQSLNTHTSGNKVFIGVVSQGLQYSAISMSAGEQKVFYILEKVLNAKNYSLLLIDELDLLLHDQAFKRLVTVIIEIAESKKLQLIFTTHRESIIQFENEINIRHIVNKGGKTLCFNESKPAAIDRLTGQQSKPIDIFVEDDLSESVVRKISTDNRIGKLVSITKYGACINCFSVAAGLLFGNYDISNTNIIMDGDLYTSDSELTSNIARVITGTDENSITYRAQAKELISFYNLPQGIPPEPYIHSIISNIPEGVNQEFNEIIECANEIGIVNNDHNYIDDIINRIGWDKKVGLSKIIDLFSTTPEWSVFTESISEWMMQKGQELAETTVSKNENAS
ncbi:AAA family ATPase [Tenacibaculum finnmarkense genomovar ulcerans]|uniref:AAA family ATPase n=1 Tax=Tenacibaculum finnmarkense TaxID=2781243 RepID=UPI00187B9605|nr:AAA family ATPase [Tenacibaculum finnmarkense]MBE7646771.1 AAA family ATPase [Tenacibaculum finnmarkense genomovar ulcerans]MBE7689039.1 AAA family ATPase [Tenacibaculum finnmarkense genomovar ulcerans]